MELSKAQKRLSYTVFGIYIFLLTWLILFKFQVDIFNMPHKRNLNLIPFAQPKLIGGRVDISEMLYNVAVFVPLGVYICVFFEKMKLWQKLLLPLGVSVLYESAQFIFAIGLSDITDVITNTAGGAFGVLVFVLLRKWLGEKTVNAVGIIGACTESAALAVIAILLLANL